MTMRTTNPDISRQTDSRRFLNRELSWLEFNRRVLQQALDDRTPLLERMGFLAIFNSNLDEFFQKRVGGIKRQIEAGVMLRTPDGLAPREQLAAIRAAVTPMLEAQADCYTRVIKPTLARHGLHLLTWEDLTPNQQEHATAYFHDNLFPVLTPLAVDPGHPFPFISNLSTSLGVMLRADTGHLSARVRRPQNGTGALHFARVKVPAVLPQWIELPAGVSTGVATSVAMSDCGAFPDMATKAATPAGYCFISLEEIIRHNLGALFEGMELVETEPFRITRNADVERDEEDAEDLLEMMEQELRDRRFAQAIRLEVTNDPAAPINRFLRTELGLEESDIYRMPAELDYTDLWTVYKADLPELKFEPWIPAIPARLADEEANVFNIIRAGDVLVHHPYESFSASVERFIRAAANDPDVIAIKLTLYRTSEDSPFIPEIIRAAEAGKQVVCLVELKARFDEKRNLSLAQALEKAGVHVVYGVVGYKTHTKTALVVRREADGVRCYAHIGTGNYNSQTAQLYTDLGLFTCDPDITADLVDLFHYLTGRSAKRDFRRLLVAPTNMRRRFVELIDREIQHAQNNDTGLIIAKMNSLEDRDLCNKLYEASQAGVTIKLIVRGFCCLRPGVPGLSDNITVMSVIGRFLEHSRIYYFHNNDPKAPPGGGHGHLSARADGAAEYYIGSADWMYRNLNNRVETVTPILDPNAQHTLAHILEVMLADHRQGWDMQSDGSYVQRQPPSEPTDTQCAATLGTHQTLMNEARARRG